MTRSRQSAKTLGTRFERQIADHLALILADDRIDRRTKTGSRDRGDLTGLRIHGRRLVAEIKNTSRICLSEWVGEAHTEAGNDDALAGIVIHKRRGVGDPGRQFVTMTVDDFAALISGARCGHRMDIHA